MAFPQVVELVEDDDNGVGHPSYGVAIPSSPPAGQLLIGGVAYDLNINGITWPAGWTELFDSTTGGQGLSVAYRVTDGTETSPITVTGSGASDQIVSHVYRISGNHAVSAPEVGVAATGLAGVNPDPPSLSPSWGSEETLWIAMASLSGQADFTAAPTDYTNLEWKLFNDTTGGANPTIGSARRERMIATEDPGTFTVGAAVDWSANTIAIRPVTVVAPTTAANAGIMRVRMRPRWG